MYRTLCVKTGIKSSRIGVGINEPIRTDSVVEKSGADSVLNLCHRVSELFCYSLALQSVDSIRLGGGWHDDKCHHGCI